MKFGLVGKILLVGISVTVLGAGAVYWASSFLFTRTYVSALQSRSIAIAQSLKIQMDRILLLGIQMDNLSGFERQCHDAVKTYEGLEFAMVVGRDGTILFHSDASRHGEKLADTEILKAQAEESEAIIPYSIDGTPSYAAVVPITGVDGAALGSVVVGMSAKLVDDKLRQMQFGRLGVALLVLLGGLTVFVTGLSVVVIRPLRILIRSIDELRADTTDLSGRVPLKSDDELGALAAAFNALMQNLQETTVSRSSLATAYKAVKESEAKYRQLLSSANAIILRLGPDGTVTYFNEYAERFFGYSSGEMLGRHVVGTIVPQYESGTGRDLSELMSAIVNDPEAHDDIENENITRDGRRVIVRWANRMIRDAENRPAGVLCIGQDITEKKVAEKELHQHRHHLEELVFSRTAELAASRDAAEAANRAKSFFLANMSHELRTPMNGIMGMTDLVLRRATDPQQIDWLRKSKVSAQHLLAIINDILDISKIEADRLILEEKNFSLAHAMDDVLQMQDAQAQSKGLRLVCEIDPALPDLLCGDELRLRQILLNFIGNAIKFSERGQITVRLAAVEQNSHSLLLRIEVSDQGIGIGPEHRARLFQAFAQADGSMTRKYGGTGLGLIISKRIALLMGGDAGVSSEEGVGSTFWATCRLRLPAGDAQADSGPEGESPRDALVRLFPGARILVAEDEPVSREVAVFLLEDAGLAAEAVVNGQDAVEKARGGGYDLILMDMQMPVMNGVEATRALRRLPGTANIPILAMTANAFEEDRQVCLAAGMDDHVSKPIEPNALYAMLLQWLRKSIDPARG